MSARRRQPSTPQFRFRSLDTIGNASAESDDQYLSTCFVDTGLLGILRDCSEQRAILLGRTGAGKTALVKLLAEREDRVLILDPHSVALSYLSNSTVLQFFESLGVRMDQFYRFLWRHVFVIEILKRHLNIEREDQQFSFFMRMRTIGKPIYRAAFEYLNKFGTQFIATTEERIKEATRKVETSLEANADGTLLSLIRMGAKGAEKLSEEQKTEFHQRGQEVINSLQLYQLNALFDALNNEFLTDEQKHYFFVVDKLDEDWTDEPNTTARVGGGP
jgi:adenylate kinase family enzyme